MVTHLIPPSGEGKGAGCLGATLAVLFMLLVMATLIGIIAYTLQTWE